MGWAAIAIATVLGGETEGKDEDEGAMNGR